MSEKEDYVLRGTTLRVYRYMYRRGPLGIHELQRGLELSSPSVAEYHIKKLMQAGLVREKEAGYVVERVLFENMVRIRRTVIPYQTTYLAFFAASLAILLTFMKPTLISSTYLFSLLVILVALLVSIYETARTILRAL